MAEKYKVSINVKPRFGDEFGATGVVYDLTYFNWARDAMGAYARELGAGGGGGGPAGAWGATTRMEAVYTTPLLMTEEAKVYLRVSRIGRSSMTGEVQINEATSGRQVATITFVQVTIDPQTGRAVPVSDEVKQRIIDFEGKENVEVAGG